MISFQRSEHFSQLISACLFLVTTLWPRREPDYKMKLISAIRVTKPTFIATFTEVKQRHPKLAENWVYLTHIHQCPELLRTAEAPILLCNRAKTRISAPLDTPCIDTKKTIHISIGPKIWKNQWPPPGHSLIMSLRPKMNYMTSKWPTVRPDTEHFSTLSNFLWILVPQTVEPFVRWSVKSQRLSKMTWCQERLLKWQRWN